MLVGGVSQQLVQRQDVTRNLREQQRATFEKLYQMNLFVLEEILTIETLQGQEIKVIESSVTYDIFLNWSHSTLLVKPI